mmetsp:Transcript_35631/g.60224  ORF Transcript_35631/g.60224 Transcript_35631/m.60224 type:complete len:89 (-) Transcript_35631:378-644(-)
MSKFLVRLNYFTHACSVFRLGSNQTESLLEHEESCFKVLCGDLFFYVFGVFLIFPCCRGAQGLLPIDEVVFNTEAHPLPIWTWNTELL